MIRLERLTGVWLAAIALWLAFALPVAAGRRTLFFRDVFSNHFVLKAFGAEALARGEIPAFLPAWGLGQPFRGNPSALAFYPGNLLYLVLPFWSAYNLHFALHWLLALLTFHVLAREIGLGRPAALLAALTYAGSGYALSGLTFYNLIAVLAWWPLAMAGALAGGRRGVALGGLACGLALLGGEPVTAALGVVPLLVGAVRRHGVRRGLATAAAVGAVGLAVALPQLVATLRISEFTWRGGHGLLASQAVTYSLHPARLLEWVLPLPFGRPLDYGASGFWANGVAPRIPFVLTLHCGIVALGLAAAAVRRQPAWAALAGAGVALAWLAGLSGELLLAATAGLFRFPEKFLFWTALALPLLAGWGLEAALGKPRRPALAAFAGGGLALVLAAAVALARPAFVALAGGRGAAAAIDPALLTDVQLGLLTASLAAAGALLLAAGLALRRRAAVALVALQLAALVQLAPLVRTDDTAPYRAGSPWRARLGGEAAVFVSSQAYPTWHPNPRYRLDATSRAALDRLQTLDLAPVPGVLSGLSYPLYPDLEGMSSPLYTLLLANLPKFGWPERVRWMEILGVDAAVLAGEGALAAGTPGLEPIDRAERAGVPAVLVRLPGSCPPVWWPQRLAAAPGPRDAIAAVNALPEPCATAVVPEAVAQAPGGRVRVLETAPDRIVLEVDGGGGVAAVQRSYHPLWRAREAADGGAELELVPLDLTLTGLVVPAGRHTVELSVSSAPEAAAGIAGLIAAGLCGWALRPRRRAAAGFGPGTAPPAHGAAP